MRRLVLVFTAADFESSRVDRLKEMIADVLRGDPNQSDRGIARRLSCSSHSVARVRKQLFRRSA
jgi:hypothetical protein